MEEKLHYINLHYLQSILHIRCFFHGQTVILWCKLYLETYLNQKTAKFNYWITRHGDIGLLNGHTSFIYFYTDSTSNHELEYWFVNFISYILLHLIITTFYNLNEPFDGYRELGMQDRKMDTMTFTCLYHITDCRTDQCECKENVEGRQCDRCKGGFFGLLPNHPNGCLSCW